jgi:hypothetical protein
MKAMKQIALALLISIMIWIVIVGAAVWQGEKARHYLKDDVSLNFDLPSKKVGNASTLLESIDMKQVAVDELNNNVKPQVYVVSSDVIKKKKRKKKLEHSMLGIVGDQWVPPIHYDSGSVCSIDIYVRKGEMKHKVYGCILSNALFVRSIDLAIERSSALLIKMNIQGYTKKNPLTVLFSALEFVEN